MPFRAIRMVIMGAVSTCALAVGCKELTVQSNGSAGAGGSAGSEAMGGSAGIGSGGSAGATGSGGSAGAGGGTPGAWWNASWTNRVRISFQNAEGQALNGFPVMVRLDDTRIQSAIASPTGADLRFIDGDGQTVLPHEVDGWTPNGNSFVWVRVPTIDATNTDHIWLYYGNSQAADTQNPTAVWNGFLGVYHLSTSQPSSAQFPDSTGTATGAWGGNKGGTIAPGVIHDAISINGIEFVDIGDNNGVAADPGEARTVEAWVNPKALVQQAIVYEEGQCVGWHLSIDDKAEYLGYMSTEPALPLCDVFNETIVKATAAIGKWQYVTLVIDRPGLQMRLFVNGTLASSTALNNTELADGNGIFRIGSDHDGSAGSFIGMIDEVRVSNGARSDAWIAAQHRSMTDTFLTFTPD